MKKWIMAVLVLCVMLNLCAYTAPAAGNAGDGTQNAGQQPQPVSPFAGTWKANVKVGYQEYATYEIVLRTDGTGSYRGEHEGTWLYSEENNHILLRVPGAEIVLKVGEDNGKTTLSYLSDVYYAAEDFADRQPGIQVVGSWKGIDNAFGESLFFGEDHTGEFSGRQVSWTYDQERNCWLMAVGVDITFTLTQKDGIDRLSYVFGQEYVYVRQADYETVRQEIIREQNEKLRQGKTEIQPGVAFQILDSISVTVQKVEVVPTEENGLYHIVMTVTTDNPAEAVEREMFTRLSRDEEVVGRQTTVSIPQGQSETTYRIALRVVDFELWKLKEGGAPLMFTFTGVTWYYLDYAHIQYAV